MYVPDGTIVDDPGIGATRHFAYYTGVFATAPNWDAYRGTPNPDPATRVTSNLLANAGPLHDPLTMVRSVGTTGNDALALLSNGLIFVLTTQTGHGKGGFPTLKLPSTKIPMDLAITSNNELAVVTCFDTERQVGQLAVIALEGVGVGMLFHTFREMGLPN